MNRAVIESIRLRQIDSFQKLRFLLFLYQHPGIQATIQEFARQLYLGDTSLLEKIINDLHKMELVERAGGGYKLHDKPDIRAWLFGLAQAFDDPLDRQEILNSVQNEPLLLV